MNRVDGMQLFIAVVEKGSMAAGARATALSLSSVSRHIAALEERLGVKLLVRSTRSLSLTDAGRVYYEKSKRLLADVEEMEASLTADAKAPVGRLHVTGPTLFGRVFLMPLLATFLMRHPKVTLDVSLQDHPVHPIEEGIDVAVMIGALEDSGLMVRKLGAIRWIICAAPSYLRERGTPQHIDDLSAHDCLVYGQHSAVSEWELQDGRKTRRVRVPTRMRSNTFDGVVAAALEGCGLIHAPAWLVAEHVAAGRLKAVMRRHELPARPINAVFTHSRLMTGKVRALLDFFADELGQRDFDLIPPFRQPQK